MEKNKDLEIIKDNFGEGFMHLCRSLFPTILETEGLLSKIILEHFAPSRALVEDLKTPYLQDTFKDYIFSFVDVEQEKPIKIERKTPEQLFLDAGYILYPECKTEEEIQAFRKYYIQGEELCTFWGGRLNSCRVWFAVKKNVDKIKREDFFIPQRQDEYGTSVISIQFTKCNNSTLSIKNRYNHAVNNPDATFSNNLDDIVPGLMNAFEQTYGINLQSSAKRGFEIPGYVLGGDGKYYKYNYERGGCYFCENNVFINQIGTVKQFDKSNFLLFDDYLLDLKEKKLSPLTHSRDGFYNFFQDIKKIDITYELGENKHKIENKIVTITPNQGEQITIKIDKYNRMIEYTNPNITELRFQDDYFRGNKYLQKIDFPNLTTCGDGFCHDCELLTTVLLPKLTNCGSNCFRDCGLLTTVSLPNLIRCGSNCLYSCDSLTNIELPKLIRSEDGCFSNCESLKTIYLPSLVTCGDRFLSYCKSLEDIRIPNLTTTGSKCFNYCDSLTKIKLPNLIDCGYECFEYCKLLRSANLPSLTTCENGCFCECRSLTDINLPNLKTCGDYCFYVCGLTNASLPSLIACGGSCFSSCKLLTLINLPNLEKCRNGCFNNCDSLTTILLPNLTTCGYSCFYTNKSLKNITLPSLTTCRDQCFCEVPLLTTIALPNLTKCEDKCFSYCKSLKAIDLSSLETCGNECFYDCYRLENVNLPKLEICGEGCFDGCKLLKNLTLPNLISGENDNSYIYDLIRSSILGTCVDGNDGCSEKPEEKSVSIGLPSQKTDVKKSPRK